MKNEDGLTQHAERHLLSLPPKEHRLARQVDWKPLSNIKEMNMIDDPKAPEPDKDTSEEEAMEEAQEDAAHEREDNGGYQ